MADRMLLCLLTGWLPVFFLSAPLSGNQADHVSRLRPEPIRKDTIHQGIKGTVYRVGGNRMPDPHHPAEPPATIRSTVYIFELTNISQVHRQGSSAYFTSVGTRLVGKTDTDDKGFFQIGLSPGAYSLFTRKGGLYYASRMDEKNNIAPVEVLPGKVTPVECRVESDHRPVY